MQIPKSKGESVKYFERLNPREARVWMYAMLHEKEHLFPGKEEDFPVQAIINCHPYLTAKSKEIMSGALESLLTDWKESLDGSWSENAVRALLSLIAGLSVVKAKLVLQDLVSAKQFSDLKLFRPAVLRAIATLSTKEDILFWNNVKNTIPEFIRMADQVLSRIA